MLRMPSAAAPSSSACSAMRLRSRQVIWRIGSTPLRTRKCEAARLDMCAFDPAPSVTLIAGGEATQREARGRRISEGSVDTGGEKLGGDHEASVPKAFLQLADGLLEDCSFSDKSILDSVSAASVARRPSAPAPLRVDARHELRCEIRSLSSVMRPLRVM